MSRYALVALAVAVVILTGCAKKAPLTPSAPWADILDDSLCFFTTATDPSGLKLQYVFDWGNGDTAVTGYCKSGDTAVRARAFPDTGTFHIKVKARNEQGRVSKWSDECLFHASRPPQLADTIVGFTRWAVDRWYRPTVKVTDPDGDSVSVKFIWGDSMVSNWSPFVASGGTVTDSVKWQTTGRHVIHVLLKDKGSMVNPSAGAKFINVSQMAVLWYVPAHYHQPSPTLGFVDGKPVLDVSNTNDEIECYDLGGQRRWKRYGYWGVNGKCAPSVSSDGLSLYAGGETGQLVSYDTQTGNQKWYTTVPEVSATPAVGPGGAIYVTTKGGVYKIRDCGDSAVVDWNYSYENGRNDARGVTVSQAGVVYLIAYPYGQHQALVALDSTGALLWEDTSHVRAGDYYYPPVIDSRGRLVISDEQDSVYCFNLDGTLAWTRYVYRLNPAGISIGYDDRIFVSAESLHCFDSLGNHLWSAPGDFWSSTACVAQDSTLVAYDDEHGRLTCYGEDGQTLWEFSIPDSLGLKPERYSGDEGEDDISPLIGPDGNVYVTNLWGLACIACGDIRLATTAWPTYNHDNARSGWAGRPPR